jgi:hypothetical protein
MPYRYVPPHTRTPPPFPTEQLEREGCDFITIVLAVMLLVALVLGATGLHSWVSYGAGL